MRHKQRIHRFSIKKNSQSCFHHNFVKFPPPLIIFGTDMAKTTELCKVHSFSTSFNLRQCTTIWNTDASHCYTGNYLYQIAHLSIM